MAVFLIKADLNHFLISCSQYSSAKPDKEFMKGWTVTDSLCQNLISQYFSQWNNNCRGLSLAIKRKATLCSFFLVRFLKRCKKYNNINLSCRVIIPVITFLLISKLLSFAKKIFPWVARLLVNLRLVTIKYTSSYCLPHKIIICYFLQE